MKEQQQRDIMKGFSRQLNAIILILELGLVINLYSQTASNAHLEETPVFNLSDCIELALENNEIIKSAELGINIAKSQNKQAKSADYPSINLSSNLAWLDEDPNYIFPSFEFDMSGLNLGALNLNIPPITVPQQNIKLMDKLVLESELKLVYPLYTGGKISSIQEQTKYNIEVEKQNFEGVKSELIYNVSKAYYGLVLLKRILLIGDNAIARLEATLSLTENLYRKGSGSVTKLDYLKNRMMVESVQGIVETFRGKYFSTKESLKFLIGYSFDNNFEVSDDSLSTSMINVSVDDLTKEILNTNTDLKKINSALKIYASRISEAESDLLPNIAIFGFYKRTDNNYNYGYVTNDNKNQFGIGIGLDFPIFEGFRSVNKIDQAEIEYEKLKRDKTLLKNSILMNIKMLDAEILSAEERVMFTMKAKKTADESESLTKRAYQNNMAPIEDYLQSQIMGSLTAVQHNLAIFDLLDLKLKINQLASTHTSR